MNDWGLIRTGGLFQNLGLHGGLFEYGGLIGTVGLNEDLRYIPYQIFIGYNFRHLPKVSSFLPDENFNRSKLKNNAIENNFFSFIYNIYPSSLSLSQHANSLVVWVWLVWHGGGGGLEANFGIVLVEKLIS